MGTAAHASDEDHQLYARLQDGQGRASTHISSVQITDDGAGSIPISVQHGFCAAVNMAESAPDRGRGFLILPGVRHHGGLILAAIVCTTTTIVGDEGMLEGWWRLPFLLTIPLGLTAL